MMINFIEITIAQIDYNEKGAKSILIKASEISEIMEASVLNVHDYRGGYCDNCNSVVVMTNGNVYKAIESKEEIISRLRKL